RGGLWAVSEIRRDNGLPSASTNTETHTYAGGRSLVDVRGWMGVEKHTLVDQVTGSERVMSYDNHTLIAQEMTGAEAYVASLAGMLVDDVLTVKTTTAKGPRKLTFTKGVAPVRFSDFTPLVIGNASSCEIDYDAAGWDTPTRLEDMVRADCWQQLDYDQYGDEISGNFRTLGGEE